MASDNQREKNDNQGEKAPIVTVSPVAAAREAHAPASNRAPRPRAYRNALRRESDESFLEEIVVADPRHPLFGRKFSVIRRVFAKGNLSSYEVEYLGTHRLLVPTAATEPSAAPENHTKLSLEALSDLILTAELIENGDDQSGRALGAAASERAAPDCGRTGGDTGGYTP